MKKLIVSITTLVFLFLGLNRTFATNTEVSYLGPVDPTTNGDYYAKQTSPITEDVCFLGPVNPGEAGNF